VTISTCSRAPGQSPPSNGRWWIHSMYGVSASNRRSSRSSTSTSSVAIARRPAAPRDGRSGTGSSGISSSTYGKVGASGTHARQPSTLATSRSPGSLTGPLRCSSRSGISGTKSKA
jgi:hypothetical protein